MDDRINPDHYKRLPAEAIEIIEAIAKVLQSAIWKPDPLPDAMTSEEPCDKQREAVKIEIPEGWRELEPKEIPKRGEMFWHNGKWHELLVDGTIEYERYKQKHIRKIEQAPSDLDAPVPPDGWRWIELGDKLQKGDGWIEESDGKMYILEPCYFGDMVSIKHAFIRKIETFGDRMSQPAEQPKEPEQLIPDPGEGYRLLRKDPPEPVRDGDEFSGSEKKWRKSVNHAVRNGKQSKLFWYRRKIEQPKEPEYRVPTQADLSNGPIEVEVCDNPDSWWEKKILYAAAHRRRGDRKTS